VKVAIIGGSGLETLLQGREMTVNTPYGEVQLIETTIGKEELFFIPRHGKGHVLPPHKVNFRANIKALQLLNVERIIGVSAVGIISKEELKPGDLVVIDDFVDFTKARAQTFYDGPTVRHVDMTQPYCPEVRSALIRACEALNVRFSPRGVYACTEGPRLETPAEIRMMRALKCDVVGMSGIPEAVLARELGICYAMLCICTNYAAGLQDRLTFREVLEVMRGKSMEAKRVILESLKFIPKEKGCSCSKYE